MAFLELHGVEKVFGKVRAIKGIDLAIEKREFVVFVGPSGCGKSTLLRMIAGLETVDSGSIHLDGRDITNVPSPKPAGRTSLRSTITTFWPPEAKPIAVPMLALPFITRHRPLLPM